MQFTRRRFIGTAAVLGAITAFRPALAEYVGPLEAELGRVRDLDSGEPVLVRARFMDPEGVVLDQQKLFVRAVKDGDGGLNWIILSAICTHLKCGLEYRPEPGDFLCPCHDSTFDLGGRVQKKPARRDLPEYSADAEVRDGRLYLLRSRRSEPATSIPPGSGGAN